MTETEKMNREVRQTMDGMLAIYRALSGTLGERMCQNDENGISNCDDQHLQKLWSSTVLVKEVHRLIGEASGLGEKLSENHWQAFHAMREAFNREIKKGGKLEG